MFVLLLILVILLSWRFARIPGRYTAAMVLGVWIASMPVLALWPQSALARLIGGGPQQWALAGGFVLLVIGYRKVIGYLKRNAVAARNGATEGAMPVAVEAAARLRRPSSERTASLRRCQMPSSTAMPAISFCARSAARGKTVCAARRCWSWARVRLVRRSRFIWRRRGSGG
ncbi:hypothetical protein [Paracoccus cavernae]|uniref:hypothetical protein n=1 Tax=Paracoccus cavernae TaxID=1571207 RepID=UPI00363BA478